MAQSKYTTMDKDSLVAEIKARRKAERKIAVDLRANEDNLRAALDADDVDNGDFAPDAAPKPPTAPEKATTGPTAKKPDPTDAPEGATELTRSALHVGAIARADGVMSREVPDDLDEYKGKFKYRRAGEFAGEVFGLKIVPDETVRAHKTHHAKSPRGFWDGTEAEFRDQFDKL